MTLRRKEGRLVPQVVPIADQPAGLPAPPRPPVDRDEAGRFRPGAGTQAMARKGAQARSEAQQLAKLLSLRDVDENHPYAPYARLAREFRDDHLTQLAATVGGGTVGPGPASIVSSAALQLAASRYLSDLGAQTGDVEMLLSASRLADASRANVVSASDLCAREARSARPKPPAWAQQGK